MVENLYNERILELAATLSKVGRLENAEFSSEAISRLCGSKVTVDIEISGNKINNFSHLVKACALGQASSSVMAKKIIGIRPGEKLNEIMFSYDDSRNAIEFKDLYVLFLRHF